MPHPLVGQILYSNAIAPRKAKIVYNFGLCECNRVKSGPHIGRAFCARNRKSQRFFRFIKMAEKTQNYSQLLFKKNYHVADSCNEHQ